MTVELPEKQTKSGRPSPWTDNQVASWYKQQPAYKELPRAGASGPKITSVQRSRPGDGPQEAKIYLTIPQQVAGKAGPGAKLTANGIKLWGSQENYERLYNLQGEPGFWKEVASTAPGYDGNKQFELGWSYALKNKHVRRLGTIDISKASLDAAFARGAAAIGTDLTDMFNAITDLVDHVGKFFLLDCDGGKCTPEDVAERGAAGKEAVEDTNTLKRVVDAKIAPQIASARQLNLPGMGQEE